MRTEILIRVLAILLAFYLGFMFDHWLHRPPAEIVIEPHRIEDLKPDYAIQVEHVPGFHDTYWTMVLMQVDPDSLDAVKSVNVDEHYYSTEAECVTEARKYQAAFDALVLAHPELRFALACVEHGPPPIEAHAS